MTSLWISKHNPGRTANLMILCASLIFVGCQAQENSSLSHENPGYSSITNGAEEDESLHSPAADVEDANLVASMNGSEFKIPDSTADIIRGTDILVSHYFAVSAPITTTETATTITANVAGEIKNNATPVISFKIQSAENQEVLWASEEQGIHGEQQLMFPVDLPPGQYLVTIQYFRDSVGEMRPNLTLKNVSFYGPSDPI